MNIFRSLAKKGIVFDFVVHSKEKGFFDDEIASLGGTIYYAPNYRRIHAYKKWWNALLTEKHFDLVHSNFRKTSFIYLYPYYYTNIL